MSGAVARRRVLWLLRHGHAAPAIQEGGDFERPLDTRGQMEIRQSSERLSRLEPVPTRVLVSPARRTEETAAILERELAWSGSRLCRDARLYLAPPAVLLTVLGELPSTIDSVLVIGHNPGLSELATWIGGARPPERALETGELCRLEFQAPGWELRDPPADAVEFARWPP